MKAFVLLLLASVFISSSCSKSVLGKYSDHLEGTWILKQESGGFAGQVIIPDKITTLTFQADSKYSTSYNNQPADKGTYIIKKAGQPNYYYSNTLLNLFSAINGTLTYGIHIANDSLFLDEGCCDRFSYTYVRQQ